MDRHSPCLSLDELSSWTGGTFTSAGSARVASHLQFCERCAAELTLLEAYHSPARSSSEAADLRWVCDRLRASRMEKAPKKSWIWSLGGMRWLFPVAATACLLIVAAAAINARRDSIPALPPISADAGIERAAAISLVAPLGDMAEAPVRFEWKPLPGAAQYRLRLLEVDGSVVWEQRTDSASISVPGSALKLMLPMKTLWWRVAAFGASGQKLAESESGRFRVSR